MREPFSAIMMVGVLVLPDVVVGVTDASTTRSRSRPINLSRSGHDQVHIAGLPTLFEIRSPRLSPKMGIV